MGSQLKRVQITCMRVPSCDYITETGFSRSQSCLPAILNGLEETQKITKVPNVELSHNWPDISQFLIKRELLKQMTLKVLVCLGKSYCKRDDRISSTYENPTDLQFIKGVPRSVHVGAISMGLISLPQHFSSSFPVKQYSQYNEPDWAKPVKNDMKRN